MAHIGGIILFQSRMDLVCQVAQPLLCLQEYLDVAPPRSSVKSVRVEVDTELPDYLS